MKTIAITGNDTGVGKTSVAACLARRIAADGLTVQYVKVVETGIEAGLEGDAERVKSESKSERVESLRLFSFKAPLAPISAAREEEAVIDLAIIQKALGELPAADVRLIEGAGGVSVPLDEAGHDMLDLCERTNADYILIVVDDRLGAINQARLADQYIKRLAIPRAVWLNEVDRAEEKVKQSNREELRKCGVNIIASSSHRMETVSIAHDFWKQDELILAKKS